MTRTVPPPRRPAQTSCSDATGRVPTTGGPLGLAAWREVARTGTLPDDSDPDATAAGLVRRWHQHLAVAIDLPVERLAPGEERLLALLTAWLDLARRTSAVREYAAAAGGPRAAAETARQSALLARLLAEDLAVLDAPEPHRSALDLLTELASVAAAEDAAGQVLRDGRATLLGTPPAASRAATLRERLTCRFLHPAAVG